MNQKLKRIICGILIIINCIMIFNLSAQDAEKSSKTSGVVVDQVVNTVSNINKKVKKETLKDRVTFIVRKCAHFTIYTLLGILLLNFAITFNITKQKKIIFCLIFGMLYAISDEFHQSFVGGRSPEIRDVCIDTCGVLTGILLVLLVGKIIKMIKSPRMLKSAGTIHSND